MHYLYIYFVFLFVSNKRQNGWTDWAHIFLVNLHVPGKVYGSSKLKIFDKILRQSLRMINKFQSNRLLWNERSLVFYLSFFKLSIFL